jgi:hypothetical protein
LFLVSLNQFKCVALGRNSVLKINKCIYLAINNYLMLSLNDILLYDNNLKQIDIPYLQNKEIFQNKYGFDPYIVADQWNNNRSGGSSSSSPVNANNYQQ